MPKYRMGDRFDYVKDEDYGVLPSGEVVFLNKNLPQSIKERLMADVKREMDEFLHPPKDKPYLTYK